MSQCSAGKAATGNAADLLCGAALCTRVSGAAMTVLSRVGLQDSASDIPSRSAERVARPVSMLPDRAGDGAWLADRTIGAVLLERS